MKKNNVLLDNLGFLTEAISIGEDYCDETLELSKKETQHELHTRSGLLRNDAFPTLNANELSTFFRLALLSNKQQQLSYNPEEGKISLKYKEIGNESSLYNLWFSFLIKEKDLEFCLKHNKFIKIETISSKKKNIIIVNMNSESKLRNEMIRNQGEIYLKKIYPKYHFSKASFFTRDLIYLKETKKTKSKGYSEFLNILGFVDVDELNIKICLSNTFQIFVNNKVISSMFKGYRTSRIIYNSYLWQHKNNIRFVESESPPPHQVSDMPQNECSLDLEIYSGKDSNNLVSAYSIVQRYKFIELECVYASDTQEDPWAITLDVLGPEDPDDPDYTGAWGNIDRD